MDRIGQFAGHHQHTFPADKMLPKTMWDNHLDIPYDPRDTNKPRKRIHNRKSRAWFRREIQRMVRGESSKL